MPDILPSNGPRQGGHVLEAIYTGLLVAAFLVIAWFAVYTVWKLYQGQR
jgi:hypothetical protein